MFFVICLASHIHEPGAFPESLLTFNASFTIERGNVLIFAHDCSKYERQVQKINWTQNRGHSGELQDGPQKERGPVHILNVLVGFSTRTCIKVCIKARRPVRFLHLRHKQLKSRIISVDNSPYLVRVTLWDPTRNAAAPPMHL